MNLPWKSTPSGRGLPAARRSAMRLWAASRPVRIVPLSRRVSPTFQELISSLVMLSRNTLLAPLLLLMSMSGQFESEGGTRLTGPLPSSVKSMCLDAAQFGMSATGLEVAWVGYDLILTSTTVVSPPSPWAPMPRRLILS